MTEGHERIAIVSQAVMEGLSQFVPGAKVAKEAVKAVEHIRQRKEAQRQLERALQAAESAFVNTALKDSELHPFARLVANLPQQNLPTFRAALKVLLDSWNEDNLQSTLEANLERDAPVLESAAHRRTAALYLTHLHAHLVRLPVYR